MATVREQGWAATTEEFEIGLNAVAAPILDATGSGGGRRDVRTSLPAHRGVVPVGCRHLLAGAKEISARLGHFGPMPGSA